ncbi:MAG: hypothetical protein K2P37_01740 [Oscillospiraceae bacterium]|nr:hypothetical protein [Oscillospiraceae bacterium]
MAKKRKGASPMLKKLTSFLLSLLLCLSLLPGQACAAGEPDSPQPPAVVEPLDPEEPVRPMSEELPEDNGNYHIS